MKKIAIIIPYFGKLPNYFDIWKKTALFNNTIDFLIFTDNFALKSEQNINVFNFDFADIRNMVQKNFNFKIKLDKPYKFCDFRPAYGEIFSEYLKEYDFWGYCDVDMMFGDIRKFLTNEILDKFDKLLIYGHLSLFRNTPKLNTVYKLQGQYPEMNYEHVFTSNDAFYFDEYGGMQSKCKCNNINVFDNVPIFNILPIYPYFEYKNKDVGIEWVNGNLYVVDEYNNKIELIYVHYSKRNFEIVNLSEKNIICVYPNMIEIGRGFDINKIKKSKHQKIYRIKYVFFRMLKSKNGFIKNIQRYKWSRDISNYINYLNQLK